MHLQGRCVCQRLRYTLDLESPDDARTTLCHCNSCRRAFGTNYGLTAKVPVRSFRYLDDNSGSLKTYKQENGVVREFCGNCGAFICEYGVRYYARFSSSVSSIVVEKLTIKSGRVVLGRGCRQVSLRHVGDVGRAGEDPAKGGVLLQEPDDLDARDSRCVF